MNARFRRLTDLFTAGKTVPIPDGTYLWVQALNAFERDECLADAQVARARMVLAHKRDPDERNRIEARLLERGRDAVAEDLSRAKTEAQRPDIIARMEDDREWKEKIEILRRTDFSQSAMPPQPGEDETVKTVFEEWADAVDKAMADELAFQMRHYAAASDKEIVDDYLEMWSDRRAGDHASAEYGLTERWYATRYCDAVLRDTGTYDHTACDGHTTRVFENKQEARSAPDGLTNLLSAALVDLAMGGRDPKGSANPTNSSDSSPTRNEQEESTPSTSTETQDEAPGTSSQLLATP